MIPLGLKKIAVQIQVHTHNTVALPCPQLCSITRWPCYTCIIYPMFSLLKFMSISCLQNWPQALPPLQSSLSINHYKMPMWRGRNSIHVHAIPITASPASHSSLTVVQRLCLFHIALHKVSLMSNMEKFTRKR